MRKIGVKIQMAALVALLAMPAWANAETVTMKTVMKQLGTDYQALDRAILAADFEGIKTFSGSIADHPQPGMMERISLLSKLGSESGRFKELDQAVHEAAVQVNKAAGAADMGAVLKAHETLLNNCVQCHASFRK